MTAKLVIEAELPNADLEPFLDHIRKFDLAHSGCRFWISANSEGDETVGEIVRMLERVGIPLVFVQKK